jgi:hypothetical protein
MSIGLPAFYTEEIEQTGSRENARQAAVHAFEELGWNYEEISRDLYKVELGMNGSSWGEVLTVSLSSPGVVIVQSKCIFPIQMFDWGKNRRNVKSFIDRFSVKELRDLALGTNEPNQFDSKGESPVGRLFKDEDDDTAP